MIALCEYAFIKNAVRTRNHSSYSILCYRFFRVDNMQKLQYQISPRPLQINSQSVRVKALNNVVRSTTPEEKEPSCPMFFAMTKQVTVLADPNMIMMETSLSFVKPQRMARGRKSAS